MLCLRGKPFLLCRENVTMNEASLYIHSFLMHKDIPFLRYCHAECASRKDWQAAVKKLNVKALPVFSSVRGMPAQDGAGKRAFLLELSAADKAEPDSGWMLGAAQGDALRMLRCSEATLSPLSLVFDKEKHFYLSVSPELCKEKLLCFPCADARESVVLSYGDFMERFVPEACIRLL